MSMMDALTVYQPWASAIALGVKHSETRSWRAPERLIGQRMVLHAAAQNPLVRALGLNGWFIQDFEQATGIRITDCPLMAILGTFRLVGCWQVVRVAQGRVWFDRQRWVEEDKWGDYTPGRWVWGVDEVEMYEKPFRCPGKQGIWKVDVDAARKAGDTLRKPLGASTLFQGDPYAPDRRPMDTMPGITRAMREQGRASNGGYRWDGDTGGGG